MNTRLTFGWVAASVLALAVGCGKQTGEAPNGDANGKTGTTTRAPSGITSAPLQQDRTAAPGDTLFERLPGSATGVTVVNKIDYEHPLSHLYTVSGFAGGGVAIGDYNNDGLPDLFLAGQTSPSKLYRNLGNFKFEDVTERAGLSSAPHWASGASFVDIDNDGDLDLYVCYFNSANECYVNQCDVTFTENAKALGLDFKGASVMAAFADYDRDGRVDMYLVTNRLWPRPEENPGVRTREALGMLIIHPEDRDKAYVIQRPDGSFLVADAGQADHLYRQNEDGTFTNVSEKAGIDPEARFNSLSASWWDYDHDGDDDLYVANDFWDPDFLYRNNGDGTFTNVIAETLPHTPWFSMGTDAADINNDGLIDLLATDMSATTHLKQKILMGPMGRSAWFLGSAEPRQYMRNALYLNTGTHRFAEIAFQSGIHSTDWTWSVKFADLDNDGWVDLFVTNGLAANLMDSDLEIELNKGRKEILKGRAESQLTFDERIELNTYQWNLLTRSGPRKEMNLAFQGGSHLHFDNVTKAWGLDHVGISMGAALGDLDGDGDLDIVVNNVDEKPSIYRNRSDGRRIVVKLVGTKSNRLGLGASLRAEAGGQVMLRQHTLCRGYTSANAALIHFGLGDAEQIDSLEVTWPSGAQQRFENLKPGMAYTITEPADAPATKPSKPMVPAPRFVELKDLPFEPHQERAFDDFAREPLLPNRMSQLGPGLAVGDVNSNGREDLVLAGAADQATKLYINLGNGYFEERRTAAFGDDIVCEDMQPLLVDVDGDGDLDLYITSGSNEYDRGHPALADRLYLNDGTGGFTHAPKGSLPDLRESTGAVSAADFDGDGDLDLFVAGRQVPGQYPVPPRSFLLRNEGGRFEDVTGAVAPQLRTVGMVTAALWSDVDNDGKPDLMLAIEWGPPRCFRNDGGKLADHTTQAGLADALGWWNSITSIDLDGDGDLDYVVGNVGKNTKYHPSEKKPVMVYYADFDGDGINTIVEAKYEGDRLLPVRGRSCSSVANPFIKEKFETYRDFGNALLGEIYDAKCLDEALKVQITMDASCVLINETTAAGEPRFTIRKLPDLAQVAPTFGLAVADFDGDGRFDVFAAQNFFGPQVETGHMDGSVSLLMTGSADGTLQSVWPNRSGIVITGDAKAAATTDLNGDGWPDLLVTRNNDSLVAYRHSGTSTAAKPLAVRLVGKGANSAAVGARVTLTMTDGRAQLAELHAGHGYLSQSSTLYFTIPSGSQVRDLTVRWPDGSFSWHQPGDENLFVVPKP